MPVFFYPTIAGDSSALGTGLLDYDHLQNAVRPNERHINQVVEHWLPWQSSPEETCRQEAAWTTQSLNFLFARNPQAGQR